MKKYCKGYLLTIFIFSLLALLYFIPTVAGADQEFTLVGIDYELPDNSEYNFKDATPVSRFFYGDQSMGELRLIGAIDKMTTYNGFNAYGINGGVSIHYVYGGRHQLIDPYTWYVDDDGTGKVNGFSFGSIFKGVGHGCIIVEKSTDAKEWSKVQDPVLNYFTAPKKEPRVSNIHNSGERR